MADELAEARKALRCLYITVDESVARDVGLKCEAAFTALRPFWQPIETAPTDGTHIILFWPQRPPADIGWWTIDERPPNRALAQGFKAHGDKCIPPEQPTHRMQCPLPPLSATERSDKDDARPYGYP